MATVLPCTFCDGAEPGALMVTAIETGDTVIVGQSCRMTYGLVLAGVTPEIIDDVLADIIKMMEASAVPLRGAAAEDQADDAGAIDAPAQTEDAAPTPPAVASEDAAPPAPAAPQPAPRRPRKATPEPDQRARVHDQLAARPDSPRTSADADE